MGASDQIARAADPALLDLRPGTYSTVVIEAGATAIIRSGAYYFRSLEMQPGSIVKIDNGNGPVFLWVRDALALGGTMMEDEAAKPNVLIGYAGSAAPAITGALRATLVAPAAEVALPAGGKSHLGAVFAGSLRVDDGAVIDHRAFEGADVDYAAAPDYQECIQRCQYAYYDNATDCGKAYASSVRPCDTQFPSCVDAVFPRAGRRAGRTVPACLVQDRRDPEQLRPSRTILLLVLQHGLQGLHDHAGVGALVLRRRLPLRVLALTNS